LSKTLKILSTYSITYRRYCNPPCLFVCWLVGWSVLLFISVLELLVVVGKFISLVR